jgi:hypothetical protein
MNTRKLAGELVDYIGRHSDDFSPRQVEAFRIAMSCLMEDARLEDLAEERAAYYALMNNQG